MGTSTRHSQRVSLGVRVRDCTAPLPGHAPPDKHQYNAGDDHALKRPGEHKGRVTSARASIEQAVWVVPAVVTVCGVAVPRVEEWYV